jgi:hypothetical protein
MTSPEELRAEARRLMETVNNISDPQTKQELAARAFELSERAEAIANSIEDPDIIRMNITRFRAMLAAGISGTAQKKIVEEMLADAEALLANLPKKGP